MGGGTFQFQSLSKGNGTANFNWSAGTIGNISGSDFDNANVRIALLTAASHSVSVDASRTGTFGATAGFSGVGSLTKTGLGELILNGASTHSGGTTVAEGTLVAGSISGTTLGTSQVEVLSTAISLTIQTGVTDAIADSAVLRLAGGGSAGADFGFANLQAGVNETVSALYLGGILQTEIGTYGSTLSGATFQNEEYFAGTGTLTVVVPEPNALTSLIGGLAMMLGLRRSRRGSS